MQEKGEYYANRARELIEELGEEFPGHPGDAGQRTVEIVSDATNGLADLRRLVKILDSVFAQEKAETSATNDPTSTALVLFRRGCVEWAKKYRQNCDPGDIKALSDVVLKRGETGIHLRRPQTDGSQMKQWKEWWHQAVKDHADFRSAVVEFIGKYEKS